MGNLMSRQGAMGVIHTDDAFAPMRDVAIDNKSEKDLEELFNKAKAYLEGEELKYYHQFFPQVSSLEEFLEEVRKLFDKNSIDGKIFKRFSNAELIHLLPKNELSKKEKFYARSPKIRFIFEGAQDSIKIGDNEGWITVTPKNITIVKNYLNQALKRTEYGRFSGEKLTNEFIDIFNKDSVIDAYEITINDSPEPIKTIQDDREFKIEQTFQPDWTKNYMKELRNSANKEEADRVRELVKEALMKLKAFVFKDINEASTPLKLAMTNTWNELFPPGADVLTYDFFFEGTNYIKALIGQFGEFSRKVHDLYLQYYTHGRSSHLMVDMIGSIFEGGQEPRSDLQIMLACGAKIGYQSKNIDNTTSIETNTTAALIEKNFGSEVTTALVNYFKNLTYQQKLGKKFIEDLEKIFADRFFQAMNLNVNSELDSIQTNTFYFIGGDKIVPASRIIQTLWARENQKPSFTIHTAGIKGYSTAEYEAGDPAKFVELKYWHYPKGINSNGSKMILGDNNESDFQSAASRISISTSFSISALLNSGEFDIFRKI